MMKHSFAILTVCALFAAPVLRADQVILNNGDRITGKIVKKEGDTLTVESVSFGTVTLPWSQVQSVTADAPLNVALPDATVKATLQTSGGQIQVAAPGQPRTVTPAQVVTLRNDAEQAAYERLLRPGLLDLWTINGSLNLAGTRGNAETSTITTPVNLARQSKTSTTTVYFNSIRSSARIGGVKTQTARAVRGGWAYSPNLTPRVFLNFFNDYEFDQFQSLDLRVVLGAGAGYHLWKSDRGFFDVVGGAAWNREKFDPAPAARFTRSSGEVYWGNNMAYKLNSRVSLTQGFRMFNNMTESGQYRMNFDLGAATAVTKWLTWNVSLSDRYLSNPVPGRKNNDFLYSTGFGFTFAR